MRPLTGRRLQIASGLSGLPDNRVLEYRQKWAAQGIELPEWEPATETAARVSTKLKGVGDFIGETLQWFFNLSAGKGCKCKKYADELNKMGPDRCEQNIDAIVARLTDQEHRQQLAAHLKISEKLLSSWVGMKLLRAETWLIVRGAIKAARKAKQERDEQIRKARANVQPGRARRLGNAPTIPPEPIPFTGPPQVTLLFHVWPHGDTWRKHLDYLQPVLPQVHRKILGIAYDETTASVQETKDAFGQGWEYVIAKNKIANKGKHGLREVATYKQMLPKLTSGVNDVTLCLHGKGAQGHTHESEAIRWWIEAMYQTVAYNLPEVIERMRDGAAIVGSFRRHGSHFRTTHKWHYSGTYYAFRNCIALSNGVPSLRQIWWGTESWPGDYFPLSSSACIFGDGVNDLYDPAQQPRDELKRWRAER